MSPFSSVPKPFMALCSASASARGSNGIFAYTVGMSCNVRTAHGIYLLRNKFNFELILTMTLTCCIGDGIDGACCG